MICRFEDRQAGTALALHGARTRLTACHREEMAAVFAGIEAARQAGHWVAILADYELGEWLLPEAAREPWSMPHDSVPAFAPPSAAAVSGGASEPPATDRTGTPRLTAWVFEHATHEAPWRAETDRISPAADARHAADAATQPVPEPCPAGIESVTPRIDRNDYLAAVAHVRTLIERGELYQLNYTFPLDVKTHGSAADLYRRLSNRHPSAHAAFIEDEDRTVLSFSPELFLKREGDRVTTRPMKGTAPRFADPDQDRASGEQLQASVKDRAENLMIVDLLRNDLGKIAAPGGVRVEALLTLEQYPSVWTLTSTVSADLPDVGFEDIMRALFPCGSITGAPKIAAMQHIRALEKAPRGVYCGAIGWLAPDGDFSLNVAIRTLVLDNAGRGHYSVGGGIVHDSSPELEWQECLWKARVLTS